MTLNYRNAPTYQIKLFVGLALEKWIYNQQQKK